MEMPRVRAAMNANRCQPSLHDSDPPKQAFSVSCITHNLVLRLPGSQVL